MKINYLILSLGLATAFGLQSCGGSTETKTEAPPTKTAVETTVVTEQEPFAEGKKIYMEKCIVCHTATGEGIPGAFPSLVGSEFLLNDKVGAVAQALNGAPGGRKIKGVVYAAPMPPQVNTKEEAVAVINYVLNNFGNKGGTVSLEEVSSVVINPR